MNTFSALPVFGLLFGVKVNELRNNITQRRCWLLNMQRLFVIAAKFDLTKDAACLIAGLMQ